VSRALSRMWTTKREIASGATPETRKIDYMELDSVYTTNAFTYIEERQDGPTAVCLSSTPQVKLRPLTTTKENIELT
jgi:hypothetical protein